MRRLQKIEATFNVKEYRINGESSHITQVTMRKLFNYVKLVVSSFASLGLGPSASPGLGIFGESTHIENSNEGLSCEPLHMRDLRKLQTPFTSRNQPAVIVRLYTILISMDPLRCIVLHDRLILLLPDGADSDLDELGRRLYQGTTMMESEFDDQDDDDDGDDDGDDFIPADLHAPHRNDSMVLFPFVAVETVVSSVVANLEKELAEVAQEVRVVLKRLHSRHSASTIDTLDLLRALKNRIASQEARAHMTKVALEDVLNDEEDMALMSFVKPMETEGDTTTSRLMSQNEISRPFLLSLKRFAALPIPARRGGKCPGPKSSIRAEDHDMFETIFEAFAQNVSTVETSLDLLRSEIVNGEQFHELCLTTARNRILSATLGFTIISMCTSLGSFVGSIFGMNVTSGVEQDESLFVTIAVVSSSFIVLVSLGLFGAFAWAGVLSGV
jgi:Mg2+ and Co2+ transporter CorA